MGGINGGNPDGDLEIFNRFSRIVREKFTGGDGSGGGKDRIDRIDAIYGRPEFASEKRILNEMNGMGLSRGMLSGVACFAFLRISPGMISRMLQRRAARGGWARGGDGDGIATTPSNPFHRSSSSGYEFDSPNNGRPGLMFRLFRLSLDAFTSLCVGAYASLYFIDKDKLMRKFAEIPLVEGRSLLSEELCGDFAREFKKFDRRIWDENHPYLTSGGMPDNASNKDDKNEFRNAIQGFVANCRRRDIYEREIRIERGCLSDDVHVSIPPPGVPSDIAVNLDDLLEEEEEYNGVGVNGDDYFDTPFDMGDDERD
ncbi:hypothetical protein ACHAXA_007561 [Cyclostephanos tholiformis]|uniref:Uncharacterized protein n=1 Tax=Cyclostephanos tholiformis TaxID=382380 RepID=A0ABD3SR22_9STRA